MTTLALSKTKNTEALQIPSDVSIVAFEMAIGGGDFSKFSPADKLRYINLTCQSVGLNPLTLPIRIIKMDGREVMYATAECSAQLAYRDKVSIKKIEEKTEHDCYIVRVVASLPDGRTHEDIGIVDMIYPEKTIQWQNGEKTYVRHPEAGKPFKGKDWANAVMKAHTKASRRAILRICSLGIPDESELDEMPRAQVSSVQTVAGTIEQSAASRAEKLNQSLTEGEKQESIILPPTVPLAASSPQADPISRPAASFSQEKSSVVENSQPPVAATAPVPIETQEPAPGTEVSVAPGPGDFLDPSQQTEEEKTAIALEQLIGANPDCIAFLVAKGKLPKGAPLERIDKPTAAKILAKGGKEAMLRAVDSWIKGGRK